MLCNGDWSGIGLYEVPRWQWAGLQKLEARDSVGSRVCPFHRLLEASPLTHRPACSPLTLWVWLQYCAQASDCAAIMLRSSDDYRRQKELDEARKAGLAPAEVDEDGKEINPHIPQYMTNAPWYLNNDKPTLKHQRNWKQQLEDSRQWYDRGAKVFQASKWRKGACGK